METNTPIIRTPKGRRLKQTFVRFMIYKGLHGPTSTARRLDCTNQTVFRMIWAGCAQSVEIARALVEIAAEFGYVATLDDAFSDAAWTPPDGNGNGTKADGETAPADPITQGEGAAGAADTAPHAEAKCPTCGQELSTTTCTHGEARPARLRRAA